MTPMAEFVIRSSIFMAVFLLCAYYLFKHIEKVRKIHGNPEHTKNNMLILKHFFMPKNNQKHNSVLTNSESNKSKDSDV